MKDQLIHGVPPYRPKKGEKYMNDAQLEHFRKILLAWKAELMGEVARTVHHMRDDASNFPDPSDRATQESEFGLELRAGEFVITGSIAGVTTARAGDAFHAEFANLGSVSVRFT